MPYHKADQSPKHPIITCILFVALCICLSCAASAQQQGITFHAVIYDHQGLPITNRNVAIRISVRQGATDGSIIYSNEQYVSTDSKGAFTTIIGSPLLMRTLRENSAETAFFLCYESDINADGTYLTNSIQQLVSLAVPALTATAVCNNNETEITSSAIAAASPCGNQANTSTASNHPSTANATAAEQPAKNIQSNTTPSHLNAARITGAKAGEFSVSERRTVQFSQGNLQYNPYSHTWRFAEEQYSTLRNSNNNIADDYDGWIDLFGWGTSGWNSGAKAFKPSSTDTIAENYSPGNDMNNDLTGKYANADWGVYNSIENGGGRPGEWRTLTRDEWHYLFYKRQTNTVCDERNARFAKAIVCDIEGVILLPDNYIHPATLTPLKSINLGTATYKQNIYNNSEWQQMEHYGAIFLPKTYCRYANEVDNGKVLCDYWTSTHIDNRFAYYVYILDYSLDIKGNGNRNYGRAVRLVHDL